MRNRIDLSCAGLPCGRAQTELFSREHEAMRVVFRILGGVALAGLSVAAMGQITHTMPSATRTVPKLVNKDALPPPLLDINTATDVQLVGLPNISEADAKRIIEDRPYATTLELLTKGVLSETAYEAIKDDIAVKQAPAM